MAPIRPEEGGLLRFDGFPTARKLSESSLICGPFAQCSRIEIRSVGPHQCLNLGINPHLVEQFEIAQRAVQFARKNRPEIDGLLRVVVKTNTKRVRRDDVEGPDSINWMTHNHLFQWLDGCWSLSFLQPLPIGSQLSLM